MKRVFIVHRWEGRPNADWYPWLKKKLESKGFEIHILELPDPDYPKISPWVSALKTQVGKIDENTFLIGHSIGCQTILRYLESISGEEQCGGAVLVAGFVSVKKEAVENKKDREIGRPWLETPIDWKKIRTHCKKFISIFSDDDPFVPLSNSKIFEKNLNSKIVIEQDKGHFIESECSSALNSLLEIAG